MKVYTVTIEVAVLAMDEGFAGRQVEELTRRILGTRKIADCRVTVPLTDARKIASRELCVGKERFFT